MDTLFDRVFVEGREEWMRDARWSRLDRQHARNPSETPAELQQRRDQEREARRSAQMTGAARRGSWAKEQPGSWGRQLDLKDKLRQKQATLARLLGTKNPRGEFPRGYITDIRRQLGR